MFKMCFINVLNHFNVLNKIVLKFVKYNLYKSLCVCVYIYECIYIYIYILDVLYCIKRGTIKCNLGN